MDKRPEWFDGKNPANFTSFVRKGVQTEHAETSMVKNSRFQKKNREEVNIAELSEGILEGNRGMVARAIILI